MQTNAYDLAEAIGLPPTLVAQALTEAYDQKTLAITHDEGGAVTFEQRAGHAAVFDYLLKNAPKKLMNAAAFAEEAQLPLQRVMEAAAFIKPLGRLDDADVYTTEALSAACIDRGHYPLMRSVA